MGHKETAQLDDCWVRAYLIAGIKSTINFMEINIRRDMFNRLHSERKNLLNTVAGQGCSFPPVSHAVCLCSECIRLFQNTYLFKKLNSPLNESDPLFNRECLVGPIVFIYRLSKESQLLLFVGWLL
jgi:hypothetical protein